ncbi:hypothetical protein [Haloferax larsenii]|uniref:Uncharacterized protein n=1 Tax=Haloferax larsenii TaxID=302484 RepID=A0A1H7NDQ3_HALLR|nr:hypothetical protein [Haloferax larsenii]SEL21692.1 hypothetical protein SAMN04488691_103279 [Haloferax larsenii]
MDESTAWNATLHIVFGIFLLSFGGVIGYVLSIGEGLYGVVFALFVLVPALVFGIHRIVVGVGIVIAASTANALEHATATGVAGSGQGTGSDGPSAADD